MLQPRIEFTLSAALGYLPGQSGTSFNWRQNYDNGQQEGGLLNRFGVKY